MEHASIYRIFRMLEMLGSNVDYTTPELTERLDVCERSTFRYIETLKLAGCTIIKKGKNIHKLVKIPSEGIKLEELVLISSEEAYLIHRMLRSIAGDCPLVHNLELKLAAIFDAISITEIVGNKTAAENIKELKKAIKNQERVILMNYESGHTMQISNREVEPYAFSTNYTDVHAYEIATGLTRKMSLMAKNLLVEEDPLSMRDISYEEGCWWLRTVVKDLGGVGRFYLGLSDQIEIHDSPKLEAYITKRVRDNLVKHI